MKKQSFLEFLSGAIIWALLVVAAFFISIIPGLLYGDSAMMLWFVGLFVVLASIRIATTWPERQRKRKLAQLELEQKERQQELREEHEAEKRVQEAQRQWEQSAGVTHSAPNTAPSLDANPMDYHLLLAGALPSSMVLRDDVYFDIPCQGDPSPVATVYRGDSQQPTADTDVIERLKQVSTKHTHAHGTPGIGGKRVWSKLNGAVTLAKLVNDMGFHEAGWQSWWSLHAGGEVDCVLAHGSDVFLIDARIYQVGEGHYLGLNGERRALRETDAGMHPCGELYGMDSNLYDAVRHCRAAFPTGTRIHAAVALCPTPVNCTPGVLNRVEYPGSIPLVQAIGYLLYLRCAYQDTDQGTEDISPKIVDALNISLYHA